MNNNFELKKYEILSKEELAPETFLLRFKGTLNFKPGQFVQAQIDHFGEATFAPCSDPDIKDFFELCIRSVGSVSEAITDLLPGDFLQIRGPYGNGWPIEKIFAHDCLLISGGMGIVPLRPLLLQLEKKRFRFGKIRILAGFKTPEQVLFEKDFKRWIKKFQTQVLAEYADHHFWGEKGLITKPIEKFRLSSRSIVFICGPEIMYPHCIEALNARRVKDNQIYLSYERRMECGIGLCQHCSCGKFLVCQNGPVFRFDKIKNELDK